MIFPILLAALVVSGCSQPEPEVVVKPTPKAPKAVVGKPIVSSATQGIQVAPQIERPVQHGEKGPNVPDFWVRPGFKVELVEDGLGESRFLTFDDQGLLYMSKPREGKIVTLKWDGKQYVKLADFVTKHQSVHGMQFYKGWLWFTESGAILKARCDGTGVAKDVQMIVPRGSLPSGGHFWRSILVDDDGFYTSIGDSGNISEDLNTDRQRIWRYSLDGKQKVEFCWGLRNTEKLRYRPGTQEIWGFDHGSDWYGKPYGDKDGRQPITDDMPPEQLHHYKQGGFYGHPYFVWGKVPRAEYANRKDLVDLAEKMVLPEYSFGAHWAPNGWCFYTGSALPKEMQGDAFVAFHGSWNRKVRAGYCIQRVLFDKVTGRPYGSQTILSALGPNQEVWGRPVDVEQAPDGSLLYSDDLRGQIYRITWTGTK